MVENRVRRLRQDFLRLMNQTTNLDKTNATSLLSLAKELEQRIEQMTSSIDEMRLKVHVLVQRAELEVETLEGAAPPPDRPAATDHRHEAPAPVSESQDEDPREAVRRAVEEARAEQESHQAAHFGDGWSGPNIEHGLWSTPIPNRDAKPRSDEDEEHRAAVRRMAEDVRAELAADAPEAPAEEAPSSDDTETGSGATWDDEATREAVRLAVEKARADMAGRTLGQDNPEDVSEAPKDAPARDEKDPREAVRRMVERTRAELMSGAADASEAALPEAEPEDEDPREAVRRAVEASRAELGLNERDEEPLGEEPARQPMHIPSAKEVDSNRFAGLNALGGPSLIVIEDPEGRVELVQVYATLDKISKSAQASLLNYTPHSVTVGLNAFSQAPSEGELESAAEAVFGRPCQVVNDGTRLSVVVGAGKAA